MLSLKELIENAGLDYEQVAAAAEKLAAAIELRDYVGRYAFEIDSHSHELPLPEAWQHNICLAADITVGWGPGTSDWEQQKTPFLIWFYRWFWQGRCPECGGAGKHEWVDLRQEDGSYEHLEDVTCWACGGSGNDARSAESTPTS